MNTKSILLRRIATSLACTGIIAGGAVAQPSEAQASSTLLITVGTSILDAAIGQAFGIGFDELLGAEGDPVALSAESFAQIEDIVSNVIGAAFFADYQAHAETAVDLADIYVCDPNHLDWCWTDAIDVHEAALVSVNEMQYVGLQGTASYGMMASLEIAFFKEMYGIIKAMGNDVYTESYREDITGFAEDHIIHLLDMQAEWDDAEANSPAAYWRESGTYLADAENHYDRRGCYEDFNGDEHCSPSEWECTCPFFVACGGTNGFDWQCDPSDPEWDWAVSNRAAMIESTRDVVLGEGFEGLVEELKVYGSGWWVFGTATDAFCQEYGGRDIILRQPYGVVIAMNQVYVQSNINFNGVLTVECLGDDTVALRSENSGYYLKAEGSSTVASANLNDNGHWEPLPQLDGTWAFRAYDGNYMRTSIDGDVDIHDSIDEYAVYTVAFGHALRFRFDEESGSTTLGGFNADQAKKVKGNLEKGVSWTSDAALVVGPNMSALSFDGVDDYVEIADDDMLDFGTDDDFTVSVWLKPNANQVATTKTGNNVVEKWSGSGGYPFVIRYYNQTSNKDGKITVARYDGSTSSGMTSSVALNDGEYHHVVFVKRGDDLELYIDGELDAQNTDMTTGTTTNSSPLYIGRRGGNNTQYFKGKVDDLRILPEALSAAEIQAMSEL